jgi:hypothetical protein
VHSPLQNHHLDGGVSVANWPQNCERVRDPYMTRGGTQCEPGVETTTCRKSVWRPTRRFSGSSSSLPRHTRWTFEGQTSEGLQCSFLASVSPLPPSTPWLLHPLTASAPRPSMLGRLLTPPPVRFGGCFGQVFDKAREAWNLSFGCVLQSTIMTDIYHSSA